MANETNLLGVIEIYDSTLYEKVKFALSKNSEINFFNIAIDEIYLNNRGSMLIPFAKCFRAGEDDDEFIDIKTRSVINLLFFVEMFSIEIFVDSFYIKNRRYLYISANGKIEVKKDIISFAPMNLK